MNRHAAIELDWADGKHTFRLGLDELEELEQKLDTSLFALARRLHPDVPNARTKDIVEILRIGLIGGGKDPATAFALVRRYVDERPIEENRDMAYAVVLAGLARVHPAPEDDAPGEAPAAKSNA